MSKSVLVSYVSKPKSFDILICRNCNSLSIRHTNSDKRSDRHLLPASTLLSTWPTRTNRSQSNCRRLVQAVDSNIKPKSIRYSRKEVQHSLMSSRHPQNILVRQITRLRCIGYRSIGAVAWTSVQILWVEVQSQDRMHDCRSTTR